MKAMLQRTRFIRAVGTGLLLGLAWCGPALSQQPAAPGQQIEVSGKVTTPDGRPIQGATVRIRGTSTTTQTDATGKYSITAPADGVLVFGLIGYRGIGQSIGGRSTVNVAMEPAVTVLPEVVVTGYTSQRRQDITGGVAVVDMTPVAEQTPISVLPALAGQASGVTVDAGGSPGARNTVRIRGISSFQNNDPLYIVDGTPVSESYMNFLNPNDIGSIQVLKDASAASIYGERGGNGVVIIETKRGRPGGRSVTLDVRTGVSTPVRGYDDILMQNSLDYFQVVKAAYRNAGLRVPTNIYGNDTLGNNPSIPAYIWPNTVPYQTTDTLKTSSYSYPNNLIMPGSAGTNWWKAVFGTGSYKDANLSVSGGGEDNSYLVSFGYFDQYGTAAYNRLQRGTVRVNTTFNVGKASVGEYITLSRDRGYGGLDDPSLGENNIIGKNMFEQPVIPIYDIAGNFASGKAVGLGNTTNPLKIAFAGQNNISTNDHMFGNVFGALDPGHGLGLKTRLGFHLYQGQFHGYSPTTFENSEVTSIDGINENYTLNTDWNWSNTLTYSRLANQHSLSVLLGQEAGEFSNRFETGNCANLLNGGNVDARYIQDALCDPTSKNVSSSGFKTARLSFFGKADYNFGERYYANFTVRRDGASQFSTANRWATFPAIGLGWRLSREPFLSHQTMFSNIMLRFGWGVTGNSQIPAGRIVSQYGGGRGDTFYDIGGTNTSVIPGFKVTAIGNPDLKWEEDRAANLGLDLEAFEGRGSFSVDLYNRASSNLLYDPRTPATAGSAAPPIVNIGKMTNKGIDFSVSYRSRPGAATTWSVTLNGSHYRNRIDQIDGTATFFYGPNLVRDQNPVINMIGQPIGAFYGLVALGYYKDSADAAPYAASGAKPGRIKFADVNGDGQITAADRQVIGSPHPDFTGGLDVAVRRGAWEVAATLFANHGNKIFDVQKYWYVFRYFDTNVVKDRLSNAWTPTNQNAKYPILDAGDTFSRQFSSYWLEDGSYLRLRTLQVAYNLPPGFIRWIPVARVYVQAENLFTLTGYSGLDPALPNAAATGAAGDIRDQFMGVDQGSYPSNRTFTIGITTTF